VFLQHKLLRERELAQPLEHEHRARNTPRRERRRSLPEHRAALPLELSPAPLDSHEPTDVLVARTPHAEPL